MFPVRGPVTGGAEGLGHVRPGVGDALEQHLREAGAVGPTAPHAPGFELPGDVREEPGGGIVTLGATPGRE